MATASRKSRALSNRPPILEAIRQIANDFIVGHYAIGCLGGVPRQLPIDNRILWIVPIYWTSPGIGPVAEVGMVAVDSGTQQVVGFTPSSEVKPAIRNLHEVHGELLQAAFLQARKA